MKAIGITRLILAGLALLGTGLWPFGPARAQVPWGPLPPPPMPVPITMEAQRTTMNNVRARVDWLKNAARTAPGYAAGGAGLVWRAWQGLSVEYQTFTRSLDARQLASGANELAELSAGIDILQEALANYEQDLNSGRAPSQALRDMCQVMSKAADLWLREFNQACTRLRVGRF